MGTTIESDWENTRLLEELAAARAEIEQLMAYNETRTAEVLAATQRLAAEQAKNVGLREALHYSLGAWEYDGISDEHGSIFQEACSRCDAPSDTSALEAIVKKAGEVMRERCAAACAGPNEDWNIFADDAGLAIRAIPAVTLEDLK